MLKNVIVTKRQIEVVRPSYMRKFKQIKEFKTNKSVNGSNGDTASVSSSIVKKANKLPDTITEGKIAIYIELL